MKTLVVLLFCSVLIIPISACASVQRHDDPVVAELKKQLYGKADNIRPWLHYPQSVMRFYRENDHSPVWISPSGQALSGKAMLMLDCVLQYGLAPKDYHPHELSYQLLATLSEKPGMLSIAAKIRFEVMLTDAMITFINHLHFGKTNPEYGQARVDGGMNMPFHAEEVLAGALVNPDFEKALLNVQPHTAEYAALQHWMYLWKGLYVGDCYEVADSVVHRVAINMERLRWADINDSATYIKINIPSYTLTFHLPDTAYRFKVVVGKPTTPTPLIKSRLNYFTTAPVWMVPQKVFIDELLPKAIDDPAFIKQNKFGVFDRSGAIAHPDKQLLQQIRQSPAGFYAKQSSGKGNVLGMLVFRIQNIPDVYIHEATGHQLTNFKYGAFSNGPIVMQNAVQLARLLLKNDDGGQSLGLLDKSLARQTTRNFILGKPVPLRITYLTCEMKDGYLVSYPDIYSLDAAQTASLYSEAPLLTMK